MTKQEEYNILHKIETPKCVCGKDLKFISIGLGYRKYCSTSCRAKSQKRSIESIEKMKQTYKQTMQKKYGVDNFWQTQESKNLKRDFSKRPIRSKESYEKSIKKGQQTNLKKYGNICSLHGTNQEKITKILEEKYGKNGIQKLANKVASHNRWVSHLESLRNYCDQNNIEIIKFDRKNSKNIFKCKVCNTEFHRINGFPLCPHCNKPNIFISKKEKEIVNYIKSIYNKEIIENTREVLPDNKELDIYLPELKLAIEYNGSFWHGFSNFTQASLSNFKQKHEYKRLECQKLGIRLITIDECDYLNRPEVYQRFISDLILPRTRIFARNCEIKQINTKSKEAKNFCEYYHVNGFRGGEFQYGLYYKNDLICVAIFKKYKSEYECVRLCYKTGFNIIGGWAKIQKHFGKRFLHYVNLNYFSGKNKTGLGYRFLINGKVLHRGALQKKTGLSLYCKNIDQKLSDFQNCLNNGAIAIFDQGNDIRWYN